MSVEELRELEAVLQAKCEAYIKDIASRTQALAAKMNRISRASKVMLQLSTHGVSFATCHIVIV